MKNILLIITLCALGLTTKAQNDVQLSQLEVYHSAVEEVERTYQIEVNVSDISKLKSILITLGYDEQCEAGQQGYFHIKHYSDGYYLKHRGMRQKLEDGNNHLSMAFKVPTEEGMSYTHIKIVAVDAAQQEQSRALIKFLEE